MTYRFTLVLLFAIFSIGRMLAQETGDTLTADILATDSVAVDTIPEGTPTPIVAIDTPLDTTIVDSLLTSGIKKAPRSQFKPDPIRAMWLALVLPGGGQIYNRKFLKLPIVYGGFLGCFYALTWNNQMLRDYSQAYLDIMDDDPNTQSYNQFLHLGATINESNIERYKEIFRKRKDRFRRWRDMGTFVMIGIYAFSVIDAYVDASLSEFDISDDLSLRVEPAVLNNGRSTNPLRSGTLGVQCSLTF